MNVLDILQEKLKEIGSDGLVTDGCGCGLDALAPCGAIQPRCHPGKRIVASGREACDFDVEIGETIYVPLGYSRS
jgi:hypothetical protein